jgi:glucan phosphoethanolaminetransferase (alkaline phosphatase superfamily)
LSGKKIVHYVFFFLIYRYGKNPNLCINGSSCEPTKKKSNSMLAVYIAVPIVVTGALAVLILLLITRKKKGENRRQHINCLQAAMEWIILSVSCQLSLTNLMNLQERAV